MYQGSFEYQVPNSDEGPAFERLIRFDRPPMSPSPLVGGTGVEAD